MKLEYTTKAQIKSAEKDIEAYQKRYLSLPNRAKAVDDFAAMDMIYSETDELMREGKFDVLSEIFQSMNPNYFTDVILLSFLTATLPAKNQIASRPKFLADTEESLKARGQWEENLLSGLA